MQVRRLEWWPTKSDFGMRCLIKSKQLPYTLVNKRYYFEEKDLREFLRSRKMSFDGENTT